MKSAVFIVLLVLAVQHLSRTDAVRSWQDRQAARIACAVAITAAREDLVAEHCAEQAQRVVRVGLEPASYE